ncbi:HNH endonuclease, partial [Trichormus variabilis]
MSFYCVYCNRIRSGKKQSEEGKTKEHFVPTSIGGGRSWHIPACKNCNELLGKTYDDELYRLSWMFEFYKNRSIKRTGRAILQNGHKIDVNFSYSEVFSSQNRNFQLECYDSDSGEEIPRIDIRRIEFELETKSKIINSYPSILKIALGGAHYLNTRYK